MIIYIGEVLIADDDGNMPRNPLATEAITVSHGNHKLLSARRLERQAMHGRCWHEVMGGARI